MQHPYKSAPDRAFWARSGAPERAPAGLLPPGRKLIAAGEKIASAGSCFAANIVPYLERAGLEYLWLERPHPSFRQVHAEAYSYHKFSAAYGNIYTARHLRQLVQRSLGLFKPLADRWYGDDAVIDPFRPGLRFPACSDAEFDLLTRQHLDAVRAVFEQADVFVFTLGLTEAWVSRVDGAVYPACPGTIAGNYDPDRHLFHNFTAAEVTDDLNEAFGLIRRINRNIRFVVTVSPVPLVATASGDHVLAATIYSKSVLRVAAQEITRLLPCATYFPAYEIVTGPQAPHDFFEASRRDVSRAAIDAVMAVFLAGCGVGPAVAVAGGEVSGSERMSAAIAAAECEEAASGL